MSRPKLLRPSLKDLQKVHCVSATQICRDITDNTYDKHEPPEDGPPEMKQVLNTMSDFMINRQDIFCVKIDNHLKHLLVEALKSDKNPQDFFKENSDTMIALSDKIINTVIEMLNINDIKNQSDTHFDEAKKTTANNISKYMPQMFKENQDFFNNFISQPARSGTPNQELFSTIIYAANFDSRLKSLLFETLPTAKTLMSVNTLATQLKTTRIDTISNTKATKENQNNILKAAVQIGNIKTSQIEASYRAVEKQIRIHSINTIKMDNNTDFKILEDKLQIQEIQKIIANHTNGEGAGTVTIIKPRTGAKQFEALALVTFKTTAHKYTFERAFAAWKRTSPSKNEKLTISRAPPGRAPGDEKLHQPKDIRKQIAGYYQNAIALARTKYPEKKLYGPDVLSEEQIQAMPVQLKTKHKPFATYWEFLDPTNNTTYNAFTPGSNPFEHHDFHDPIPNPATKNEAITKPEYKTRQELKPFKKRGT